MIIKIIIAIIVLLILRDFLAWLFGWKSEWLNVGEFIEIRKHNAAIEKKWRDDGCPIVSTTVGWRPDPWQKEDGFKNNGDGSYSRLIRGGTKQYRDKFAAEVEKAKHEPTPLDSDW